MRYWSQSVGLAASLVAGTLVLGTGAARADIIPTMEGVSGTGPFTWSYQADLHPDQRVETGNFFTIYDFAGFTGAHSEPAGWAFSSTLTGVTPLSLNPAAVGDNPAVANLTWIYSGATPLAYDPAGLGIFSAGSLLSNPMLGKYASESTKATGFAAGTPADNIGYVAAPNPAGVTPEPCTLAVLGAGALSLLRAGRRRRGSA
jgi:hypothetical protein